jgi:hypothetical protein
LIFRNKINPEWQARRKLSEDGEKKNKASARRAFASLMLFCARQKPQIGLAGVSCQKIISFRCSALLLCICSRITHRLLVCFERGKIGEMQLHRRGVSTLFAFLSFSSAAAIPDVGFS